ncbi:MAG: PD-(D/E)XK nuclease family protein [Actinomycetaceae bacterium]
MPTFVRPRLRVDSPDDAARVPLDTEASSVVAEATDAGGPRSLLALGAPGSGRTTIGLEAACEAARAGARVVLLSPARRAATRLKDAVARRLGAHDESVTVATPAAFAFRLLSRHAAHWGSPGPALISGPDEDGILAELLAAHASGEVVPPAWPESIPESALGLDAFRHELRDILARAGELDLEPEDLRRLAAEHGRGEWGAVATVLEQYRDAIGVEDDSSYGSGADRAVASARRKRRYDSARIVDEAALVLASWRTPPPGADGVDDQTGDGTEPPAWDLVVVDDYQDVTRSTVRLLRVLARDGARLLLLADPDVAVQTFRGGSPSLVQDATAEFAAGGLGATTRVLGSVHRGTSDVRAAVAALADRLPAGGEGLARRRATTSGETDGGDAALGVQVRTVRSAAAEADEIANAIRRAHLVDGLPYERCAVIVRTSGLATAMRSLLAARRIPISSGRIGALRDEPAVRMLLDALRVADTIVTGGEVDGSDVRDLLLSPIGGADPIRLRRLMRALRVASEAAGGATDSDSVTLDALRAILALPSEDMRDALPDGLPQILTDPYLRVGRVLAAARDAIERGEGAYAVLWAAWDATGLASVWQSRAVDGGPGAPRAHADLDAALALFYAAERYEEREGSVTAAAFVGRIDSKAVAEDTLAQQSGKKDVVQVLTPAQAPGVDFDLVAIAGLQEDVWPDLRRRDSILGSQALVDVVTGRYAGVERYAEARREVRDDELRQLVLAASRARADLLVTAVDDGEIVPSIFHELMAADAERRAEEVRAVAAGGGVPASSGGTGGSPPDAGARALVVGSDSERSATAARPPDAASRQVVRDLRELVAELRRALAADPSDADAARVLAHLAAEDVDGASPDEWRLGLEPTTLEPLRTGTDPVGVSPSSVEQANTCALRWALGRFGGRGGDSDAQSLGTLIHAIAEENPSGTEAELLATLETKLADLDLGEGLAADMQRAKATRLVERLAKYLAIPTEVQVEVEIDATVGDARIRGRIDRLEIDDDGTARVVDLKTGTGATDAKPEEHPQLGVYQVALRALHESDGGPAPAGGRLVYLGAETKALSKDQAPLPEGTDTWAHDQLRSAVRAMSGSHMTARQNAMCSFCDLRTSCPVQREGRRIGDGEGKR